MRFRAERDFFSCFNSETGAYFRSGILVDGRDTGRDPFQSSFPELIDVGIMGHCKHGKSGPCLKAGIECYQDGLHADNPNMTLSNFRSIASQCQGKTYQFALGGCGDPDQHEQFEQLLQICRECDIVPNFTTSGLGMTPRIAQICKTYCGAVAVSWYRSPYTVNAVRMLVDAGVKTNIHYVLNTDTVDEALFRLRNESFPEGINAVVFLLHKPVGLGTKEKMITRDDARFQELIRFVEDEDPYCRIGFDSCTVPALIQQPGKVDLDSVDTCEGARWSAYISADMKMMPCSFDNQKLRWAVDLKTHTIQEAWDSDTFEDFRNHFRQACPRCEKRALCMGGCPICPEIVLCPERETA